jgi:hypothetical protein
VEIVTLPREAGVVELSSAIPVIVIVAGHFTDPRLIFAQVVVSGLQVLVAACSGVS